jgi:hypothetical protein
MRAKKVDFARPMQDALRPAGRAAWRRLGGPAMLADLGLVDATGLDRALEAYFEGRSARWLGTWLALSTEAWLRARAGLSFTSVDQEVAA